MSKLIYINNADYVDLADVKLLCCGGLESSCLLEVFDDKIN